MANKKERKKPALSANPKLSHNNPNPSSLHPEIYSDPDNAMVKPKLKHQLKDAIIHFKQSKNDIP